MRGDQFFASATFRQAARKEVHQKVAKKPLSPADLVRLIIGYHFQLDTAMATSATKDRGASVFRYATGGAQLH